MQQVGVPDPVNMTGEVKRRDKVPYAEQDSRRPSFPETAWRYATANLRALPDFVILGTQRGGTSSLYQWLCAHPAFDPPLRKEIHYFDVHYHKGTRWYRAHFPFAQRGRITGEASPYMLFHPLAPARAARDLPTSTRFIVLLRNPVERAISHYWLSRNSMTWEKETLERGIELESQRLAAEIPKVLRGERSFGHATFSYVARGEYASQLRRWFDAVGRERILVLESEKLNREPEGSGVLQWLGLDPHSAPFPAVNRTARFAESPPEVIARLQEHFAPYNCELFELLGYELWTE